MDLFEKNYVTVQKLNRRKVQNYFSIHVEYKFFSKIISSFFISISFCWNLLKTSFFNSTAFSILCSSLNFEITGQGISAKREDCPFGAKLESVFDGIEI